MTNKVEYEKHVLETYEIGSFCRLVSELLLDGWRFDFETNDGYPTAWGSYYRAVMLRPITKNTKEPTEVEEVTEEPKKKTGRPAKVKTED